MISRLADETTGFEWIDVCAPSEQELIDIAAQYNLHPTSVQDCLDPAHLPKYEDIEGAAFAIVRYADLDALDRKDADTIRELTRKIALFVTDRRVITVSRTEPPFLRQLRERWTNRKKLGRKDAMSFLVVDLLRSAALTYERPLSMADEAFETFETRVLNEVADPLILEELYFLKRRVAVYRRMVRSVLDVVHRFGPRLSKTAAYYQDLVEQTDRVYTHADELIDDATTLLNTHISLSSNRTNDIVRVLTLFSVFFLPLTFIAGVYGMNFQHMPELKWTYGYPTVLASMVGITVVIYLWFRRRGWL